MIRLKKNRLLTDEDFDKKYTIVFIDRFDDNVAHIYEINDDSYNRVLFYFPGEFTPKDIHVYPFSVGVKELCINKQISIYFEKEIPRNRQDFIDYLRRAGCSDIVVDGFIECTAADIDNDIAPRSKYMKVYDNAGNFLRRIRKGSHFLLPTIISLLFCTNLFSEQLVLERNVNNHVLRYYDKTWFDEAGTVRIYVNEFTSASGKEKFGWAYGIESKLLNGAEGEAGAKMKNFNDEADCPLMYYIANGRFYIGYVWANGYSSEVTSTHVFYDFPEKDGYGLYFMLSYASAVNYLLTYGNGLTFMEKWDLEGHSKYITSDSDRNYDLSFNTGNFPGYKNEAKAFRTVRIRLVKETKSNDSRIAGNQISENLKAHGLWKVKSCMTPGDGTMLGAHGPSEGVITCWYGPFYEAGSMSDGLGEKSNKNLLIDYKEIKQPNRPSILP